MQLKISKFRMGEVILLKLASLVAIFSFVRIVFYLCNLHLFQEETAFNIFKSFLAGVRFDLSTIAMVNGPFILFWALPLKIRQNKSVDRWVNGLFFIINLIALLPNIIDCRYYTFTLRRMGNEIFSQGVMLTEDPSIYLAMLCDYWYLVIAGIAAATALYVVSFKISLAGTKSSKNHGIQFLFFIACIAFEVITVRGGFQRKPIAPSDIYIYAPTTHVAPLINNTTFNIIKSFKYKILVNKLSQTNMANENIYSPIHHEPHPEFPYYGAYKNKNICIIILESFSAEHIGALDGRFKSEGTPSFTPFLDTLIQKSLVFDGFSNGTISINGLTSILSSIPSLQCSSFIASPFGGNIICALPEIMNQIGYYSAFFYGGQRNSCHFNGMTSKAGIHHYYCQDEYDGPKQNIQGWGVYDDSFFQFMLQKMNMMPRPFFTTLFTLSSHHPFIYPEKYHGMFPKGKVPHQELIAYTDFSLKLFFEAAEKTDWYKDTLFILIADHTAGQIQEYYTQSIGKYSIPVIFFDPSGHLPVERNATIFQQIDIMPTVLHLVGYDQNFFAFGTNAFDPTVQHFAISANDNISQLITQDHVLQFNGQKIIGFFKRDDFLLKNDLTNDPSVIHDLEKSELFLRSFLQEYFYDLYKNEMVLPRKQH